MTFWPLTNSDYPTIQTFHQYHDLDTDFDLHRIASGFHGAFATGVACQQGTITLPDTWFRPPFWDLLMFQLVRPNSSNLPCLYSTFHLEYPLVLFRFCLSPLFEMTVTCSLKLPAQSALHLHWRKKGKLSDKQNKSPKGHWSLTWVQFTLLLKVRFLSKSESMTAIFVKSVRTATIAIFQFSIRGCIRFVAVALRSEEEVLLRKDPSLTYLMRHLSCMYLGIYGTDLGSMFSQCSWFPVV